MSGEVKAALGAYGALEQTKVAAAGHSEGLEGRAQGVDELATHQDVDGESVVEVRAEELVEGMGRMKVAQEGHNDGLDEQVVREHARGDLVQLRVRTAHPDLRHRPVRLGVGGGEDRVFVARLLMELNGNLGVERREEGEVEATDGKESAVGGHVEEAERGRDVAALLALAKGGDAIKECVVGEVETACEREGERME